MPVTGLDTFAVVTIDEVDLDNRLAHVSDKTGGKFQVSFRNSPAGILYVPAQGENWVAIKVGVMWYLDTKLDSIDDHTWAMDNMQPGEVRIKGTKIFLEGDVEGDLGGGTFKVAQTAHGFVVGNVLRYDAATHEFALAKADSSAHAEAIGIVSSVVDANNFKITVVGQITGLVGLTEGATYFLSPTTAGMLQSTAPNVVGQVNKPMLIATSTTAGYVFNFRGEVITAAATGSGLETIGLDGLPGTPGVAGATGAQGIQGLDGLDAPTSAIMPAATMLMFAGSAAPAGWFICDGTAVSRSVYSTLFGVIGTSYGVGDGSTTFNLPDMRGRVPVGLSGSGPALINALAKNEGVTANNRNISHNHSAPRTAGSGASAPAGGIGGNTTGPTSGDTNNVDYPAFLVVNYIIKF